MFDSYPTNVSINVMKRKQWRFHHANFQGELFKRQIEIMYRLGSPPGDFCQAGIATGRSVVRAEEDGRIKQIIPDFKPNMSYSDELLILIDVNESNISFRNS
ncbi:hypothetical protein PMAYCL1PPCAC_16659 [Pristionchus mayeri]|uniref:Uncharacterized protein n=1 Tax=Pristionchus mayeri TaxID=1317129 RepID=A0AAN5CLC2_9BILA|nr:hypothetical protein PMAYCL1PPCAC_16659 [Pristionchus mayeri]